jgi:transketolase
MPSWELFEKQSLSYKEELLSPEGKLNVAIEMASPQGWAQIIGREGLMIGISGFGASAPGARIAREYGFTAESIVGKIKELL